MDKNESIFYDKLKDIFIGEKIEGNSGFVNLMRIKSSYFDFVFKELNKEIDDETKEVPDFKEEMYDKLNTFFQTYFSESGSIYFTYTPLKSKVYDKIYTNKDDVILFWKTRMLYYVKTDKLWNNLSVEYKKDNLTYGINFDVSKLEQKSGNEKKEIIYELKDINDKKISFYVIYSQKGKKTDSSNILKDFKNKKIHLNDDDLDNIFKIFEKQNEVDYFINKDAKSFLNEQFDLWLKNYIFDDESDFSEKRLRELKLLKKVAYKIIDFVSQFEDELVKIWNKPKFVLNSNYVITLDRIFDKGGIELIKKIFDNEGIEEQIKEWKDLGIIEGEFNKNFIFTKNLNGEILNEKYKFLPIDTKYFKDLELNILSLFDDLDESLDGWLIHSENYQALNTILPKFKEKVQTIYIDPPFNTGKDFEYLDKFQDSTWLTLIENRIILSRPFLKSLGSFFIHLDENADFLGRILLNELDFEEIKKITFNTNATKDEEADLFGYKSFGNNFSLKSSTIYFCKNQNSKFYKLWKPNRNLTLLNIGWLDLIELPKKDRDKFKKIDDFDFHIEKYDVTHNLMNIKIDINEKIYPIGDIWNDIYSFTQSEMRTSENFSFETQKPENLIRRIIQASSDQRDIILDFFGGSGTTYAVSQKLNRKWVGIEMGDHFYEFYSDWNKIEKQIIKKVGILGRMKIVLFGDKKFRVFDKERRSNLSKDVNWDGGGFFKYYDLEQYEQTLKKCHYIPSEPFFNLDDKTIYEQYVFMKDPKLLDSMEMDYQNNKIGINFDDIYQNIDIAETLSNIKGEKIKRITENSVVLKDDKGNEEEIRFDNIDFKTIKPLIWW